VVLPNSTRSLNFPCLNWEERLDEGNNIHIYPARPRFAMTMVFKIANCQLLIPHRDALELKMIDAVQKLNPKADKKDISILARYLKIGLHNGHTVIGGIRLLTSSLSFSLSFFLSFFLSFCFSTFF
jgi:hypothetical protein